MPLLALIALAGGCYDLGVDDPKDSGTGDTDSDTGSDTGSDVDTDADTDTDTDADTDTDTDTDSDTDSDTGTSACPGWHDETYGLCWEDPPLGGALDHANAASYCTELGGGMRLPTIDELRSLLRTDGGVGDCSENLPDGACSVTDPGCLSLNPCSDGCGVCTEYTGPGPSGCFWDTVVSGTCDWYWSSSLRDDGPDSAWHVNFVNGEVYGELLDDPGRVRCVTETF